MRKNLVFIVIAIISLLFASCGEKSQIEKAQDKIVLIGNEFLDYELTAEEAIKQLDSILIPDIEGNGDLYLEADKDNLSYLITKSKINTASFEEIQEEINHIKKQNYDE